MYAQTCHPPSPGFAGVQGLTYVLTLQVALKACPYRADFFTKLRADPAGGPEASEAKTDIELNRWLDALSNIVKRMEAFYEKGGYGKGF